MQSITLLIHMTGLLLLAPNTRAGEFPLHVLMPTEGNTLPPHSAQLGWPESDPSKCVFPNRPSRGICYFDMDGWAVELGTKGLGTAVLPPPGPPIITNAQHHVPLDWFGPTPVGSSIRSRLTLNSGKILPGCSAFSWDAGGVSNVLLPNVVNWEMTVPGPGLIIMATSRTKPGSPMVVHTFASTGTVELFLRYEPSGTPSPESAPYRASHLERLYDLLGFQTGEPRVIPDNGIRLIDECPFGVEAFIPPAPGAPTCLVAGGYP